MRFASLGSGSRGNATLVEGAATRVMVDCGFTPREAGRRLARLALAPGDLDALLVTHEHSDHCAGIAALSRRYALPVYMTHGTYNSGRCGDCHEVRLFNAGDSFRIGELEVAAIAVPHDAREPCQFRITHGHSALGIVTDLGEITAHVVDSFAGCDALVLEFNHDLEMLLQGDSPPRLKRRVGGRLGHLNNQQAAGFLTRIGARGPRLLVVAHMSENNNCPERVSEALAGSAARPGRVVWADQQAGFDWLAL